MTVANKTFSEMLQLGLDYDHWANVRWYNALRLMRNQEQASPVLQHILSAQRIWLERAGVDMTNIPRAATLGAFEAIHQAWKQLLASRPATDRLQYTDSRGRSHDREIGEIVWHMINHGTFHRGHLRGLAQAEGFEEFTDTDLIYYLDQVRKG